MRTLSNYPGISAIFCILLAGCIATDVNTDASNSELTDTQESCAPDTTTECTCDDGEAGTSACTDGAPGTCDCPENEEPPIVTEEDVSDGPSDDEKPADWCEEENDCRQPGACPEAADMGCACTEIAWGLKLCVPVCERDRDCPQEPDAPMECNDDGLCVEGEKGPVLVLPGEGEGEGEGQTFQPPTPCEDQDDCDDCDYELGCTCYGGGNGNKRCRPNCETTEDCPDIPNGNPICSDDKVCVRDQEGGGGPGGGQGGGGGG